MATGSSGAGTLEMLKSMSMKAGKAVQDASTRTVEAVTEGTRNMRNSQAGTQTASTMSTLGARAAEGGSYLYNATKSTTQSILDRFSGGSVASACARETREAPCPRVVLVCCTAICSGGLASEGLFAGPPDSEDVTTLYTALLAAHCAVLLPPDATPQLLSSVLKRWLLDLRPEPLLTYKLVPALTSSSTPNASLAAVLDELPPANRAALFLILETAHRVASNAAINDTDAATLAAALSPCLLWRERAQEPKPAAGVPEDPAQKQNEALPVEDEAVFVKLLTHMITHYRTLI